MSVLVYGYMHQGGLLSSIGFVQKMFTHVSNLELDQHVIFYHTYMPPRHLVQAPLAANLVNNKRFVHEIKRTMSEEEMRRLLSGQSSSSSSQENGKHVTRLSTTSGASKGHNKMLDSLIRMPTRRIHELSSSASAAQLEQLIADIKESYVAQASRVKKSYAIFVVAPAIDHFQLNKNEVCGGGGRVDEANAERKSDETFELLAKFRFHVTFEHLKEHFDLIKCKFKRAERANAAGGKRVSEFERRNEHCFLSRCKNKGFLNRVLDAFSLHIYQVLL